MNKRDKRTKDELLKEIERLNKIINENQLIISSLNNEFMQEKGKVQAHEWTIQKLHNKLGHFHMDAINGLSIR